MRCTIASMRADRKIETSPQGVAIRGPEGQACEFDWSLVERITAYKIDLITTDQVRIEFAVGGRNYVAAEETPGWEELTNAIALT